MHSQCLNERLHSHTTASTSLPQHLQPPVIVAPQRRRGQIRRRSSQHPATCSVQWHAPAAAQTKVAYSEQRHQKETPPRRVLYKGYFSQDDSLPLYVSLDNDALLSAQHTLGYEEALRVGLKALKLLGITGVAVDVLWGMVEKSGPHQYDWSGYRALFEIIRDMGFKLKVNLCFHATEAVPLPQWVQALGAEQPDMWYTCKAGGRCTEYLTLGVDDVPILHGRTAVDCYRDLMQSFKQEFNSWLGTTIDSLVIGLGPRGELRYPSHPLVDRQLWEYPGVGEFMCYDRYMLAMLKACAEAVRQPSWGLGGPHDAGGYKSWPHQSSFFMPAGGNWASPYGKFFLQWYSELLVTHGTRVMSEARRVFSAPPPLHCASSPSWGSIPCSSNSHPSPATASTDADHISSSYRNAFSSTNSSYTSSSWSGINNSSSSTPGSSSSSSGGGGNGRSSHSGFSRSTSSHFFSSTRSTALPDVGPPLLPINARIPNCHWWYNTPSHAAELTAGYYSTVQREGYLPAFRALAAIGVGLHLTGGEARTAERLPQHCSDPERLLLAQRTVAAALHMPVTLENSEPRYDDSALSQVAAALFEPAANLGIEVPRPQGGLVFNSMSDIMFEPGNWQAFKGFVRNVRATSEQLISS